MQPDKRKTKTFKVYPHWNFLLILWPEPIYEILLKSYEIPCKMYKIYFKDLIA